MSMTLKELDALAGFHRKGHSTSDGDMEELFELAREALKARRQKPVAWMNPLNNAVVNTSKKMQIGVGNGYPNFVIPLVPQPQGKDSNER